MSYLEYAHCICMFCRAEICRCDELKRVQAEQRKIRREEKEAASKPPVYETAVTRDAVCEANEEPLNYSVKAPLIE